MKPNPSETSELLEKRPGEGGKRPWPPLFKMKEAVEPKLEALFRGR